MIVVASSYPKNKSILFENGQFQKLTDPFLLVLDREYGMQRTAALTPDNSIGRFPGRSHVSRDGSYV